MVLQNLATTTPWGHSPPRDTGRAYRTCSDKEEGFPGGWDSEESACNTGDLASIPGSRKIPWRREWLPRDKQDVSGVMPCNFWVWVLEAKRLFPGSPSLTCPWNPGRIFRGWWGHMQKPQEGTAAEVSAKSQPAARCAKRVWWWFQPPDFKLSDWRPRHGGRETGHPSQGLSKFLIDQVPGHNVLCYEVSVACCRATDNQDARVCRVQHVRKAIWHLTRGMH